MVITIKIHKSILNKGEIEIVEIIELSPKTNVILNILEPNIFPNAILVLPFLAAIILVANSGKDVPSAIANNEINTFEIPNEFAMFIAEFTIKFPPNGSKIHPTTNKKNGIIIRFFGLSKTVS